MQRPHWTGQLDIAGSGALERDRSVSSVDARKAFSSRLNNTAGIHPAPCNLRRARAGTRRSLQIRSDNQWIAGRGWRITMKLNIDPIVAGVEIQRLAQTAVERLAAGRERVTRGAKDRPE